MMRFDSKVVGKRIAARRKQSGLKQNVLAERLDISKVIPHRKVGAILPEVI